MNVSKAVEITAEIPVFIPMDEAPKFKTCPEQHPIYKVRCEKDVCTNGKHWGIVGYAPNRGAIVWETQNLIDTY